MSCLTTKICTKWSIWVFKPYQSFPSFCTKWKFVQRRVITLSPNIPRGTPKYCESENYLCSNTSLCNTKRLKHCSGNYLLPRTIWRSLLSSSLLIWQKNWWMFPQWILTVQLNNKLFCLENKKGEEKRREKKNYWHPSAHEIKLLMHCCFNF